MTNDTCDGTEVVEIKRKRPPSNAPGAARMRRHRLLRDEGKMVVQVQVSEQHIDALERAGYLNIRIERVSSVEAVKKALVDVLAALRLKSL